MEEWQHRRTVGFLFGGGCRARSCEHLVSSEILEGREVLEILDGGVVEYKLLEDQEGRPFDELLAVQGGEELPMWMEICKVVMLCVEEVVANMHALKQSNGR